MMNDRKTASGNFLDSVGIQDLSVACFNRDRVDLEWV
jgi:hypothetical protein